MKYFMTWINAFIRKFEKFALAIRRTVLHDLLVWVIRKTMQINSGPTEIIIGAYIFGSKVAICTGDEFD